MSKKLACKLDSHSAASNDQHCVGCLQFLAVLLQQTQICVLPATGTSAAAADSAIAVVRNVAHMLTLTTMLLLLLPLLQITK